MAEHAFDRGRAEPARIVEDLQKHRRRGKRRERDECQRVVDLLVVEPPFDLQLLVSALRLRQTSLVTSILEDDQRFEEWEVPWDRGPAFDLDQRRVLIAARRHLFVL